MVTRPLETRDWPRVDWLASNEVQEGDHTTYESEWGQRRRKFAGESARSIIEISGEVVAYTSIEREPNEDGWRASIVLDWSKQDDKVQEAAYGALEELIAERRVRMIWMRELADDLSLLQFLASKDFEIQKRYVFNGTEMVNLRKGYDA